MAKAYGTTSVPVERSQTAIRDLVMTRGGSGIAFIEQPPMSNKGNAGIDHRCAECRKGRAR